MKVHIYPTGKQIAPFGDPVDRVVVLDEPLAVYRERVLQEAGLEDVAPVEAPLEVGAEPALVLFDHLVLSARVVCDLVARVDGWRGTAAVLALPRGPLTDFAGPLQDRVVEAEGGRERCLLDAFLVRDVRLDPAEGAAALRERLLAGAERLTLEPRVEVEHLRWPPIRGETLGIDLPRSLWLAGHLGHWAHVLWLNRQAIETRLLEMAAAEAEEGATFAYAGREFERWSRKRKPPVYIGENCNIHPGAVVEHAVLGDNVNVDLRSLVRHAVLGDNSGLSASTMLVGCVVGPGCHTLSDTCLLESVCLPHSTLANAKLQHTLIGREAFITTGVMFYELGLDGDVQVEHEGRWVDSGRRLLGGCVGHRCILGARAMFHGGRAVPNGYMVVMKPGEGLAKVPGDLAQVRTYNEDGLLRPVAEIEPPWEPPEW